MLASCSKYGRVKELYFSTVQYGKEMFFKSTTIGFKPGISVIWITSDKEYIDKVARDIWHGLKDP